MPKYCDNHILQCAACRSTQLRLGAGGQYFHDAPELRVHADVSTIAREISCANPGCEFRIINGIVKGTVNA